MNTEALYQIYLTHPEVTTDSRRCPKGSMFFALKGANFNGNAFAHKAIEAGCAVAVIDEADYAPADDERYILVPDVLQALQQLAAYHRQQFRKPVIQITGTNGKTTTKELVAAVLSERFQVLYTQGNLNNHIGVPLTLLRLRDTHDIAVIETGANHPGEIATLTDIVRPDYGLITNVGHAHIEGFGSFEGVKRTKGELYDYLLHTDGTHIFVNTANPVLTGMLEERGVHLKATACGMGMLATDGTMKVAVEGGVQTCNPFVSIWWRRTDAQASGSETECHEVQTQLVGAYNLDNLLAASCVGLQFGVDEAAICHALHTYHPGLGRSEYRKTAHNELIIDAYNANLTSMHVALENFKLIDGKHKMLILGDMKELGADSASAHQQILSEALACGAEEVWLVGDQFAQAATLHEPTDGRIRLFTDVDAVLADLQAAPKEGFMVLIKGSNSMHLAKTVEGM